ncbi:hypothetical protein [Micromonospora sp. DH14]|uniref:hypothetical protein n=1 Tax=Micromonospora sp. DH14 TaxID=3040120 RepID=UPI002442FF00|nr:hypothetical protein [Micromonospora sp. DH14]MDG9674875.1 hypothetical protein [Micromonospora sp. DH14]
MSRRRLDALPDRGGYIVVVGWDRPLHTYFAQVINEGELNEDNPHYMPLWLGVETRITDPDTIIEAVRPYAVVPDSLRADLEADRAWEGTRDQPGFAHTVPVIPGPAPLETSGKLFYATGSGTLATCALRVYRTGIFSVAVIVTDVPSRAPSRTQRLLRALARRANPQQTPLGEHAATIHAMLRVIFDAWEVEHIEYTPHQPGEVFHAFSVADDGSTTRAAIPLDDMVHRFGADIAR